MLFLIEVIKGLLMFAAVCVGLGIVYLVFIIAREVGWVVKQESRKQYRAKQKQCGFCGPAGSYIAVIMPGGCFEHGLYIRVASNDVMVPITIDDFAIDGLAELKEQIDNTREDLNPGLRFCGCFVTQYDRTNEADTQGEEFLKTLEYPLFETHIRRTPKMKPSTFERKPIIVYSSRCGAAYDYKALVQEYLRM